jgi:hypothetical protein
MVVVHQDKFSYNLTIQTMFRKVTCGWLSALSRLLIGPKKGLPLYQTAPAIRPWFFKKCCFEQSIQFFPVGQPVRPKVETGIVGQMRHFLFQKI